MKRVTPLALLLIASGTLAFGQRGFGRGGHTQAREYRPSRPLEPEYEQPIYLIAFKDHTIQAALAYWVQDGILHFVTRQHEQKQAALEDVDRYFSEELNRTRRLEFRLPR